MILLLDEDKHEQINEITIETAGETYTHEQENIRGANANVN